jgi:putative endonuclease
LRKHPSSTGVFISMKNYNKTIGYYGEDLATDFLTKRGYKILDRNLMLGHKEIDIIAENKDCLVFVEVKTRTINSFSEATESVNDLKLHRLRRAAELFFYYYDTKKDARIDLIMVIINKQNKIAKIKHYINIA